MLPFGRLWVQQYLSSLCAGDDWLKALHEITILMFCKLTCHNSYIPLISHLVFLLAASRQHAKMQF